MPLCRFFVVSSSASSASAPPSAASFFTTSVGNVLAGLPRTAMSTYDATSSAIVPTAAPRKPAPILMRWLYPFGRPSTVAVTATTRTEREEMLFRRFALCLVVASIVTPARASADLPVLQSGTYREVDPRNGTLVRGPLANTLVIVRTGSGALRFSVTAFRPRGAAEGDAANTLPTVVLGALPAGRHRVA